jgi:hypothetical protein
MGKSCMGNRNLAIFDFDGTIADSAAWFGNALNELAQHNGFREVSAEQREMLRGRSTREIFAYLGIPSWKLPLVVRQLREIAARDVEQISIFPWVPGCSCRAPKPRHFDSDRQLQHQGQYSPRAWRRGGVDDRPIRYRRAIVRQSRQDQSRHQEVRVFE